MTDRPLEWYVVNIIWVTNRELFDRYRKQVPETLMPFAGKYVVRREHPEIIHGDMAPDFLVVLRFPSQEHAEAWRDSSAYQKILSMRDASSKSLVLMAPHYIPF